jgi:hypothetical protein
MDRRIGSVTRVSATALVAIVVLVGACTTASIPASNGPVSSGPPASGPPAASTGTGALPSNECSPVTAADVEAAYGGTSSPGKLDEHGHCAFEVSGNIHAGPNQGIPGEVGVSFNDRWTTFETAKLLFGDAVTKVDGLGTDAWFALHALHVKIAGGEFAIGALWIANVDKAIIQKDTVTLAKSILTHL